MSGVTDGDPARSPDVRDQLLAMLQARVDEVVQSRDPTGALAGDLVKPAGDLAAMAESEPDLEAAHVLGWYHWLRACALSDDERREATRLAVGWLWPIAVNEPTLVPGGALGLLAPSLREAALDLREEGLRTGSLVHIRHAATLLRHVLAEVPPDDPYRGLYLSNLAMTLHGCWTASPTRRRWICSWTPLVPPSTSAPATTLTGTQRSTSWAWPCRRSSCSPTIAAFSTKRCG